MNKGVVVAILPDKEMPKDPSGKPFEIIMNPAGVPSRKNPGQIIEMNCGKIIHEVNKKVQKAITDRKFREAIVEIMKMNEFLQPPETFKRIQSRMQEVVKDKERFENFIVSITNKIIPLVQDPMQAMKIKKIKDGMLYYNLPSKTKIFDPYIGGKTKTKVSYGYLYWEKTEHLSEKGLHARSLGAMNQESKQATKGSKHEGGQRVGELDMFALLAYDLNDYLQEIITLSSDDIPSKMKAMNQIYKNGKIFLGDLKQIQSSSTQQLNAYLVCMGVLDPKDNS